MTAPARVWERYSATVRPRRRTNAAGATSWLNWTQYPDHGPDESVLGDLDGRRVLELGSGSGANLAHLATLNARCVGIDLVPARTVAARQTWGHLPHLTFVTGDATDYLATTTHTFDVIYSIFGAVWFTEPALLLPLVRSRLAAGGTLAFSQLPPAATASEPGGIVRRWDLPAARWVRLLTEGGFRSATAGVVPAPTSGGVGTLLGRATG